MSESKTDITMKQPREEREARNLKIQLQNLETYTRAYKMLVALAGISEGTEQAIWGMAREQIVKEQGQIQ